MSKDINLLTTILKTPGALPPMIWGEPGVGKCIAGTEKVLNATTGRYVPISDFDIRDKIATFCNGEIIAVQPSDKIDNGLKPVLTVETQTGRKLRATSNHPFLSLNGSVYGKSFNVCWKNAGSLRLGDMVGVAHYQPFFGKESVSLEESRVAALLLSEGYLADAKNRTGTTITFTNSDDFLLNQFVESVKSIGFSTSVCDSRFNEKTKVTTISHRIGCPKIGGFVDWMKEVGMDFGLSGSKKIPWKILQSKEDSVSEFLRYLFSGDGWAEARPNKNVKDRVQPHICYSSKSFDLCRDVQELLAKYSVTSNLNSRSVSGEKYYDLTICAAKDVLRFIDRIGFVGEKSLPAKKAYEAACDIAGNLSEHQNGNRTYRFGLLFDRVTSIEDPKGLEPTWDLTVPVTHNFIAEGFVVHNTARAVDLAEKLGYKSVLLRPAERGEGAFGVVPVPSEDRSVLLYPRPDWAEELIEHKGPGLVIIDEITCTPPALQPAVMGLILDGIIAGHKMPSRIQRMAIGNPVDQAGGGWEQAPAVMNRLVHLEWASPSASEWCEWLMSVDDEGDQGFRKAKALGAAFIRSHPSCLHEKFDSVIGRQPLAVATPRTWESAIRLLGKCFNDGTDGSLYPTLAHACLGPAVALQGTKENKGGAWLTWLKDNDLDDPEELLANPSKFKHDPKRPDRTMATFYAVAEAGLSTGNGKPFSKEKRLERWEAAWSVLHAGMKAKVGKDMLMIPAEILASFTRRPQGLPGPHAREVALELEILFKSIDDLGR